MLEIGARPLANFDRPIDMLEDCHRRIERFLLDLWRVAESAPDSLDGEWTRLLRTALDYFAGAALVHAADEEESLFPRLRWRDSHAKRALDATEQLERDHADAKQLHEEVEQIGRRWIERAHVDPAGRARFADVVRVLRQLYAAHIQVEEEVVFVAARDALTMVDLEAIGREMRLRRHSDRHAC